MIKLNKKYLEEFKTFIENRYAIQCSKEKGDKKPWSDDVILQNYRFPNIKKGDDQFSKWIKQNIVERYADKNTLWFGVCVARQLGNIETLIDLDDLLIDWNAGYFLNLLRERQANLKKVYSGQYMLSTHGKPMSRIDYTGKILNQLWSFRRDISSIFHEAQSVEVCHNVLTNFEGFGRFICYEIIHDLLDSKYFLGSADKNSWVCFGIGTQKGLNRLFDLKIKSYLKYSAYYDYLNLVLHKFKLDKSSIVSTLTLRDLTHCLVMYHKYMKLKEGQKTTVPRYKGY